MACKGREVIRHVWAWRTVVTLFVTPIVLLPLIVAFNAPETKCAYAVILMAVYWITESLPLGITALLPVFLFPLFEIVSSNEIASQYFNVRRRKL
ncbi:unnamed protein product [Lymnaea stagnalis]|uniref:Uncharacterized protein n=1 Tax=Lymnaea stagnalis TaxID=6523 RepID=A0AAV2I8S4_LYMST